MKKRVLGLWILLLLLIPPFMSVRSEGLPLDIKIQIFDRDGRRLDVTEGVYAVRSAHGYVNSGISGNSVLYSENFESEAVSVTKEGLAIQGFFEGDVDLLWFMEDDEDFYHLRMQLNPKDYDASKTTVKEVMLDVQTTITAEYEEDYPQNIMVRRKDLTMVARKDDPSLGRKWADGWSYSVGKSFGNGTKRLHTVAGTYDILAQRASKDGMTIYVEGLKDQPLTKDGEHRIPTNSMRMQTHEITIVKALTETYAYFCYSSMDSDGQELRLWTPLEKAGKYTVKLPAYIAQHLMVCLSKIEGERYEETLMVYAISPYSTVGEDIHFYSWQLFKDRDGLLYFQGGLSDNRNNILHRYQPEWASSVDLTITNHKGEAVYNENIASRGLLNYHRVDFDFDDGTYIIEVKPSGESIVTATSYFELRVHGNVYQSNHIGVVTQREKGNISLEEKAIKDGRVYLELTVTNREEKVLDYDIHFPQAIHSGKKDSVTLVNREVKSWAFDVDLEAYMAGKIGVIDIKRKRVPVKSIAIKGMVPADVVGHWSETLVGAYVGMGYADNREEGRFLPDEAVTRGEFAAFLARRLKLKAAVQEIDFTDIEGNIYERDIQKAAAHGLIKGYPDGGFNPEGTIRRQDAALVIGNAARAMGITLEGRGEAAKFVDVQEVSVYAQDAVERCISNGIITGKPGNRLAPSESLTRAEAIAVMDRFVKLASK